MKFESIKEIGDEQFLRLTGIQRSTFEKMTGILSEVEKKKKAKGVRKNRNRRKRFGLRFNLIVGIYNLELPPC